MGIVLFKPPIYGLLQELDRVLKWQREGGLELNFSVSFSWLTLAGVISFLVILSGILLYSRFRK
ncbi:MAG: hypothetical protein AAGT88_07310 [Dethiobacter sp.]